MSTFYRYDSSTAPMCGCGSCPGELPSALMMAERLREILFAQVSERDDDPVEVEDCDCHECDCTPYEDADQRIGGFDYAADSFARYQASL